MEIHFVARGSSDTFLRKSGEVSTGSGEENLITCNLLSAEVLPEEERTWSPVTTVTTRRNDVK